MKAVKVAILWHQHQPYYKKENEFIMPWVRCHGVKDYLDLTEILHEFPNIKQTFNLVPSLMLQIEEYINGSTQDTVQRLSRKSASKLSPDEKKQVLKLFFMCYKDNMIMPYERYRHLYNLGLDEEKALKEFSTADWLDLQVWYNLTWLGPYSKQKPKMKRLFAKGAGYTEEEKLLVLEYHNEIMNEIIPSMLLLRSLGQIEISVSPMYHPILPLLCNTDSALEAMPVLNTPRPTFQFPQDAQKQIQSAREYYHHHFGEYPIGMWPSEGSISDEALSIISSQGIKWVASDEEILLQTQRDKYRPTGKYFPRTFKSRTGDISILFRDHFLSDRIGFVYSTWNPYDAARDFVSHLNHIREEIISKHGEDALDHAVIPVILDGENCWEYYQENGLPFLRALYSEISHSSFFRTVTCSEATKPEHSSFMPALNHIRAGSWINANFNIWIGNSDNRTAWSVLRNAREKVENAKATINKENYEEAMAALYIAEGSDWFWWYHDEHNADNKDQFDLLFRWYISEAYRLIGESCPEEIASPISVLSQGSEFQQQTGKVVPNIDGYETTEKEWEYAGFYDLKVSHSTMHQVGELVRKFWFATDEGKIFFRFDLMKKFEGRETIDLEFTYPISCRISINTNGFKLTGKDKLYLNELDFAYSEFLEISFSRSLLFPENPTESELKPVELIIRSKSHETEMCYPREGSLKIML
jgi:alpha-amylase/alpha-mannosidase (GH57 family)